MRVAMYYSNRDVRIEEVPCPEIGPGEVLIRIEASGICGSDVMEWYRIHKVPLVLGHEIAGEIVKIGTGVKGYKPGDRVTASHHVPCNTCHYCIRGHHTACSTLLSETHFDPGGFSEYVRVPAINVDRGLYKLPDEVSFEEATFTEPLACVVRAQRQARLKAGETVVVLGAGISGLLHIRLARTLGATKVMAVDISRYRIDFARKAGADLALHAESDVVKRLREMNGGFLADLVVVCTGASKAIQKAFECVDRGGTILFFAPTDQGVTLPLSINDVFWRRDVTLTTSYAGDRWDHLLALDLISSGRVQVKDMITHRLGLAETGVGFRLVEEAQESIKVVIEPQR